LPNLRNVQTLGIIAYHAGVFDKDNNGVSLVTTSQFLQSYLTLTVGNDEVIQNIDLQCLNPITGNNVPYNTSGIIPLNGQRFDFSKSYVTIGQGYTVQGDPVPYSYPFGIYYVK